jgi:hypothetical protein
MSDIVLSRDQGIPATTRTRYVDMGDGTHALQTAVGKLAGIAVPASAPVQGQAVIAVTGTAVRLSAVSVPLPGGVVIVKALSSNNAAHGTAGGAGLNNTKNGTGNGYIVEAGDSALIFAADLSDVYVNGTVGDIFSYSAA